MTTERRQGNLRNDEPLRTPRYRDRLPTVRMHPYPRPVDGYILGSKVCEYHCPCGREQVFVIPTGTVPGFAIERESLCCKKPVIVTVRGHIITDGMERETRLITKRDRP